MHLLRGDKWLRPHSAFASDKLYDIEQVSQIPGTAFSFILTQEQLLQCPSTPVYKALSIQQVTKINFMFVDSSRKHSFCAKSYPKVLYI